MIVQAKASINTFTTELKARIDLLSSNELTANIDNANVNQINDLLSLYKIASSSEITTDDIKKINPTHVRTLLGLVGQSIEEIDKILSQESTSYEKIAAILNKYQKEYVTIGTSQSEMLRDKINLYQKYIDLFESEIFTEPFLDLNEITKVMSDVGLADPDKWKILEYLALANNKTVNEVEVNLNYKVSNELKRVEIFLKNPQIVEKIKKKLNEHEIDIDTIPTIAVGLAEELDFDIDVMNNIVVGLIACNLLDKITSFQTEEEKNDIVEDINDALSYAVELHKPCVYEAKIIKEQTEEYYNNSLSSGITEEMINEYMETPISLIESSSSNISREYAIELKELAVLKPIYETLDTIMTLERGSDEYRKATIILKKLIEQYQVLEEKKVEVNKRIN